MSWQANSHVLKLAKEHQDLSSNDVLVLLLLSACHNAHQGAAWPNLTTLALECHLSKRSVQSVLAKLEARGLIWIETTRGYRGSRALLFGFVGLDAQHGEHVKAGWPKGKPRRPDANPASGQDPDQMQPGVRPDAAGRSDQMQPEVRPDATGRTDQMQPAASPFLINRNPGTGREPELRNRKRTGSACARDEDSVSQSDKPNGHVEPWGVELAHRIQQVAEDLDDDAVASCISHARRLLKESGLEWWRFDNQIKVAWRNAKRRREDPTRPRLGVPMAYFFQELTTLTRPVEAST